MLAFNNLENTLNNQFEEVNYVNAIIEDAVLRTQIMAIDETLYQFRDIAGKHLRSGNADVMVRYREYKNKLDRLVSLHEEKSGLIFDKTKLKCG